MNAPRNWATRYIGTCSHGVLPTMARPRVRAAVRARNHDAREDGQPPRHGDDDPAARKGLGLVQQDAGDHAVAEEDEDHGPHQFGHECFWFHAHSLYWVDTNAGCELARSLRCRGSDPGPGRLAADHADATVPSSTVADTVSPPGVRKRQGNV